MTTFKELGLDEEILKAITDLGFETPTPIQAEAIPVLLAKPQDLVGLAQTGTGKTAAFGLPICNMIDFNNSNPEALIICPTRELCMQITRDLQNFTKYKSGSNVVAIYGGASMENQVRDMRRGVNIIVATPGRMVDMIERRRVNLENIKFVVLDEADEMLNMGFKEDLDSILSKTPDEKFTWLFSATMPNEVRRIAKNYMEKPFEVTVGRENSSADNIEHQYYMVQGRDRYLALKRVVDYYPEVFGIVFCRTKAETQDIAEKLIKDGYNADALHGDLSQAQRDYVMNRYRNRHLQILVATDVAARGIDVDSVTHVINFNLPDDVESYTHRSGRTARAGKSGISLAIITSKEMGRIREIERNISKRFTLKQVPNGEEVCEKQLFHLVKTIHDAEINEEGIVDYLPPITEMLKDLSKEELIKKMVSTDFNRFLEYYRDAPDLNTGGAVRSRDTGDGRNDRGEVTGRFFINIGEMDGLDKMELRDFVVHCTNIDKNDVGRIDVKNTFSFFEVEPRLVPQVVEAFKANQHYNQRRVRIEASNGMGGGGGSSRGGSGGGGGYRGGSGGGGYRGGQGGGGGYRGGNSGEGGGYRGGQNGGGSRGFGSKGAPSFGAGGGVDKGRRKRPF